MADSNPIRHKSDLSGERFGRLTVLRFAGKNRHSKTLWECMCDCGNYKTVNRPCLISGYTKSCGCLHSETAAKNARANPRKSHGHCGQKWRSGAYSSWRSMLCRCTNPHATGFSYYGGRGIQVCERWRSFENFLADMGDRPDGTTLDRYPDKNGDYKPDNCRWATRKRQQNNMRSNRHVTAFGKTQTIAQWADESGLTYQIIRQRLTLGWSPERALTTPQST